MAKIYHYTKLCTGIKHILPKMQIRTSNLHQMNDPKENQPWAFGGGNINFKESYPDTYSDETHIDHQFELGDEIKKSCQIICFVRDEPEQGFLNEIMWAHYAENHRGICFELDEEIFIQENPELAWNFIFEPVKYENHEKISLDWKKELDKEQNIQRFVRAKYEALFFRKSKYWVSENEKRLLIFNKSQMYLTIEKSLTGIYLVFKCLISIGLQLINI